MTARRKASRAEREEDSLHKAQPPGERGPLSHSSSLDQAAAQQAIEDPHATRQQAILQLQGKIGNQAMGRLIAQSTQSGAVAGGQIQDVAAKAGGPSQQAATAQRQMREKTRQSKPPIEYQEEGEMQTRGASGESASRRSEQRATVTGRQAPPARHLALPTTTVQRHDVVSWQVHSWRLEPEKELPIMTGNEYADWIEGNREEEPFSMGCWQALLFYLYKAGTLSRPQLKAIHIRTKVLALTEIPLEQVNPENEKMFAVKYDIEYTRALRRVISDRPWAQIKLKQWNEEIPAGSIIRINQGRKVLHWLLSEGTESVAEGVVHRVKDLGSGTGDPILKEGTLQDALDRFGYATKGDRKAQLQSVQVYHTQPFWA